MKKHLIIIFVVALTMGSCRSQAPVIEANYQAQSLDIQLTNLTNQMVKSLSQERKTKIAIMEFPDLHGTISELGMFIPEELTTRLFMTRRFEVLERQLLNKVLEEQNLGMSGLIDASSAAQIGKILGVDAIVTGTITDMGNMIRINARMIATETAGVFAVASVSIDKEPHIASMMNRTSPALERAEGTPRRPVPEPAFMDAPETPAPYRPGTAATASVAVEEFEFEVVASSMTNDDRIIVEVLITNTSHRDNEISILSNCRIFDNLGQEYSSSIRRIGSKSAGRYSNLRHLFISNVPTRMTIEFANADPEAESIALLELSINGLRSNAQLRNFNLNK
ncbi:MAG: hypothetical protein EA361_02190 [Bacteroidetes bacterium]|nr:MAG: hypothetical protein EA361_02190 [Bacteroidota bacterium]